MPMANDLIIHAYITEIPIKKKKTLNDSTWRASGLVNTSRCQEGDVPESVEAPHPPPFTLCLSHLTVLRCGLYNTLVIVSELLS